MRRHQTFHETLIPLLVEGVGAQCYLELGVGNNETISKVKCLVRVGVDRIVRPLARVVLYSMTTTEFIHKHAARHAPYDFVFIDADHSARAVERDFCGIWPHVSPEGLVLLHDTNPEAQADTAPGLCGDAWKAAKKITECYEATTLPYQPGLTIVRKRIRWGPK